MKHMQLSFKLLGAARWAAPLLFFLSLFVTVNSFAANMQITPLRAEVDNKNKNAIFDVINTSGNDLSAQMQLVKWRQDPETGREIYEKTKDILAVPVLFKVPARDKQTLRTALLRPNLTDSEQAYRLILTQIPKGAGQTNPDKPMPVELDIRLQLNLPIFVNPANAVKANLEFLGVANQVSTAPDLTFRNTGNQHVQITDITYHMNTGETENEVMSVYLLPGTKRVISPKNKGLNNVTKVSVTTDVLGKLEYEIS